MPITGRNQAQVNVKPYIAQKVFICPTTTDLFVLFQQ